MIKKMKERNSEIIIEKEPLKALSFLYKSFVGRIFLKVLIQPFASKAVGAFMNTKLSKQMYKNLIKKETIDINIFEKQEFDNYNDFFIRKIKKEYRKIDESKKSFISPCDSKLTAIEIRQNLVFEIKGGYYNINELLNKEISDEYTGGYLLIFRLEPSDYHRYCYIDEGTKSKNVYIKGKFHTVEPISLGRYSYFHTNAREYTILKTKNFNDVIHVEIGAMNVGKIVNHHEEHEFKKGDEKGYFMFGGSTICLIIKKDIITLDKDIIENSSNGIETIVKYGEKIAIKN